MKTFFLLVRMRVLDVARKVSSLAFMLGLPLVLLAIVSLVFLDGHPFERRHVVYVGDAPDLALPEVTADRERSERAAFGRLDSRMASAVILPGSPIRVVVGARDLVFGRGIAASSVAPLTIETRPIPRLGYVQYLLPGLLTFSVLIAGLFGVGYAMLRYRDSMFLKKLATTPLRRSTFVGAQIVARALLAVVQVAVLLAIAVPLLGLSLPPSGFLWLLVLTLVGILTFLGMGFAIAAVVRQEAMLVDIINASTTPLVLLSEIFFPIDVLPFVLRPIAAALPTTQMVRMVRTVLLEGSVDPRRMLPGLGLMVSWLLVTFAIAVFSFRWTDA